MKKTFSSLTKLLLIACLFLAVGCSKEDDPSDPGNSVPDPEGTKSLFMRYAYWRWDDRLNRDVAVYAHADIDENGVDDLYFGFNYNLSCYDGISIVEIGPVSGLGNIVSKPSSGWSNTAAPGVGIGYVVRLESADGNYIYGRLFIEEELTGGIRVKYQCPF